MGFLLEKIREDLLGENKTVAEAIDLSKDVDEIIQDLVSQGLMSFGDGDISNDKENC